MDKRIASGPELISLEPWVVTCAPVIARAARADAPLPRGLARRAVWRAIRQWLRAEMALPRK